MSSKFAIRHGKTLDDYRDWDDDKLKWGPEGSYPFFSREAAQLALPSAPKADNPVIVEIDDDASQDDHEIDDNGYPGDL